MADEVKIFINHLMLQEFKESDAQATLYLPGFKFASEDHPDNTREIDYFLPRIFNDGGETFYRLYYSGIGESKNEFSFLNALDDGVMVVEELLRRYKRVNLICRSWGAVIGSYILSKYSKELGRVIFITPYCFIPGKEQVEELLRGIMSTYPKALKANDFDYYLEEIEEVRSKYSFIENVSSILDREVMVIAATKDKVIPIQIMKETTSMLSRRKYFEINQGHDLEKPEEVEKLLTSLLAWG